MCAQAALDNTETTEPSSSEAAQPNQGGNEASTSDSKAGPRKVKQKKKAPLVPAAQLLEDEGLNAELDAANAGGLVETERDRLIRTVSLQPYSKLTGSAHMSVGFPYPLAVVLVWLLYMVDPLHMSASYACHAAVI